MRTLLTDTELAAALTALNGWSGDQQAITRTVAIKEDALAGFTARLEEIAREMNHDPELARPDDSTLTITMTTHSAGGVTELDVAYAARVDALIDD